MAQFIGLHMRVVLRDPPGSEFTGTVVDVQAGSGLTLTNGMRYLEDCLRRAANF